ncbi:pyridoxal phosphate-dependent aminotransferase [Arenibaculum sp.]|jgi:aspartate/methionine/tyrosine aminotransferase|uniref:pyridoxal phosphate-dependent aminotransferase n=1 Tax=Arenibaculum sp. TaxID=2865862 RepID=UPI002E12F37A|nr:pyridoxal phosphate-dependent aminotransferase [Arenibaculum sp.]
MSYRPAIEALPNSLIADLALYGRARGDVTPLWFGEGDMPTPGFVVDACDRAMRDGHVFYTYCRGMPELREALSRYHERVYGVRLGADRITVHGSGMTAIMISLQAIVDPGDEVVVVTPVWPNIFSAVKVLGGAVRSVGLEHGEAGWHLDPARLFDACGPRTRAIFINSPGNPTGWTMPLDDMRALLEFARRHGIWILSDEVYSRFVYDAPHAPTMLHVIEPEDRVLVLNSFSKNWAMTGWRLGWVVAPPDFGDHYEKLVQFNNSGVPGFIQMAGVTALDHGDSFVVEMVERSRRGRDIVCDVLQNLPGVRLTRPQAAFYAFFSVEGATDSVALARRLVNEARVGLAPGAAFGEGGEGHLRLCFASSPERLEDAMSRLARALR